MTSSTKLCSTILATSHGIGNLSNLAMHVCRYPCSINRLLAASYIKIIWSGDMPLRDHSAWFNLKVYSFSSAPLAPFHSGNVIEVFGLGGVFPEKVS